MSCCVGSSSVESSEIIDEVLDKLWSDTLLVLDDFLTVKGFDKVSKDLRYFFLLLVGGIKLF